MIKGSIGDIFYFSATLSFWEVTSEWSSLHTTLVNATDGKGLMNAFILITLYLGDTSSPAPAKQYTQYFYYALGSDCWEAINNRFGITVKNNLGSNSDIGNKSNPSAHAQWLFITKI